MADVQRTIAISALYDGTKLKSGTEESANAVETLAREVDVSTERISSALRSMDDSAALSTSQFSAEVDQADSKLKDLGGTAAEEIPGAMTDLSDSAADAATGLSTAFATLGPGGIAVGAALAGIGILMRKSQEAEEQFKADAQEWTQAYLEGLGKITAATRRAKLEEDLLDEKSIISKVSAIAEAVGGDQSVLIEALYGNAQQREAAQNDLESKLTRLTGKYDEIIDKREKEIALNGRASEETEDQFDRLTRMVNAYSEINDLIGTGNDRRRDGQKAAQDLLETYDKLGLLTKEEERTLARMANEVERAADAAERLGVALGNAVRDAAQIAFD